MAAKRVVLLIETSNAYARGLLRGIRSYVRARGDWSIYLGEQRRGESAPQWLANWQAPTLTGRAPGACNDFRSCSCCRWLRSSTCSTCLG